MSNKNPTSFGRKGQSTLGTVVVVVLAALGWWFNGTLPGVDPATTANEQVVSQSVTATLAPLVESEGAADAVSSDENRGEEVATVEPDEPEPVADAAVQSEEDSATDDVDSADTDSAESDEAETVEPDEGEAANGEEEAEVETAVPDEGEATNGEEEAEVEEVIADTPTPKPLPTDTPTVEPTATPIPKPTSSPTPNYQRGPPGMPEIRREELPPEAVETIELIWQNGPFPYRQDDTTFQNREGILPSEPRGFYREFTVETPGARNRGARRIIEGENGELYYTDDHYDSFYWVVVPNN